MMTLVSAIAFLEEMGIDYHQFILPAVTIMEIPAIVSGIYIAKTFDKTAIQGEMHIGKIIFDSLFNIPILSIIFGMTLGGFASTPDYSPFINNILYAFHPLLCLFMFDLGLIAGSHKEHFRSFSWSLNLFGAYMPIIGAAYGLLLSYVLGLDVGTGTLMAVLTGSASYIAVPAAMRIALPQAKEAVYLPLSLGIAFPFNVVIGIPLYYYAATLVLG